MIVKNVIYLDSLGVEHIPKETKKIIGNKKIRANICRTLSYDSILCGYFCIGFISFMLKGKIFIRLYKLINEWQNDIKFFSVESK